MAFKAKIGQKWEVVIPKVILDKVGITPGDEIIMVRKGNELIVRKA